MAPLFDFFKGSLKEPSAAAPENERRKDSSSPATALPVEREAIIVALKRHLETVWRSHRRTFDQADVDSNEDLYETGYVDSLSAPQFLLLAEKQFGIKLPDWLLGGRAKSLAALAEYIDDELARRR